MSLIFCQSSNLHNKIFWKQHNVIEVFYDRSLSSKEEVHIRKKFKWIIFSFSYIFANQGKENVFFVETRKNF